MENQITRASKEVLTKKLLKTISAFVEVEVSAFLDGVGTVQDKQPEKKKTSKQTKIEEIRNKAKKRFS